MSGKTNRLMNQESYGDEAAEGATAISQCGGQFVGTDNEFEEAHTEENVFDVACAEESAAWARSQRAENLAGHATGTANEREEDEEEENAAGNRKQPARNPVGGGHGWEKESAPTLAPRMLGIPGGAAGRLTKQATTLPVGGGAPRAGTTAQDLHRALMGGSRTLHSTVVGGKKMGGATGTAAAPAAGQQQCVGRGSMGWSALTEAMKMFGPAATT